MIRQLLPPLTSVLPTHTITSVANGFAEGRGDASSLTILVALVVAIADAIGPWALNQPHRPTDHLQRPQVCPSDDDIRSVRVPVLAMFGGRSVVHDPVVAADRLRDLLPHTDVETLPDAGHHIFLRPGDRDRVLEFVHRANPDPRYWLGIRVCRPALR